MTIRAHILAGTLFALLAVSPASAQILDAEQEDGPIGCGMLGAGVGAAVIAAGTSSGANAWTVGLSAALGFGMQREVDAYCDHVVEVTVAAYQNALTNLGIQILWHTYHDPGMAWCLSIREHECIPYVDDPEKPNPSQQLFVEQTWQAVRSASEQMLNASTGNSARITPLALANALQSGFDTSGLQSSPVLIENRLDGFE